MKGDKMEHNTEQYRVGQWIVHSQHGIGQIKQTEKLSLHGDIQTKELCFQVQTENGVFWFPVNQSDNPRVRPIITQENFNNALETLQEPPEDTDAHHNILKGRINEAQHDGSIRTTVKLVRDLAARSSVKRSLNILEDKALKLHTERIIREWSLCFEISEKEARKKFEMLLNHSNLQTA
ncbi:MAG TPA: hypothetical protein DEH22_17975 [Chloroflexi bacterium]|nr:hypothetical protein [Chloroflexota bacterium]